MIQESKFNRAQGANELSQIGLRQANELITMDAAFLFHPVLNPERNLR